MKSVLVRAFFAAAAAAFAACGGGAPGAAGPEAITITGAAPQAAPSADAILDAAI